MVIIAMTLSLYTIGSDQKRIQEQIFHAWSFFYIKSESGTDPVIGVAQV